MSGSGSAALAMRSRTRFAAFWRASSIWWSKCVFQNWNVFFVRRSSNFTQVTMRRFELPQVEDPMTSGVSDNQK